jgi:nucleoside-diphosphate-sugar epimerase
VGIDLSPPALADIECFQASVLEQASFDRVGRVDAVIHGAALTDLWHKDPSAFARVNVGGSERAAAFAKARGARMVLISSYTTLIPKNLRQERVMSGAERFLPQDLIGDYPRSKRQAELAAARILPEVMTVLPTAPIGTDDPGPTPPMGLLRDLACGNLPGLMRGRINIVPIEDVVAMTLAALDRGRPSARYLAAGADLELAEFGRQVADAAGLAPPRIIVPPVIAEMAAIPQELTAQLGGSKPKATRTGVRLAAAPVRFDPSRSFGALGISPSDPDAAIARAVAACGGPAQSAEG